jgi:hypothetical protein
MTTHTATATLHRGASRRLAYATLAVTLLVAAVIEAVTHGTGYWQLGAFAMAPDLALFLGAGAGLAKGQLHPRAVGAYNLLHRFWGPLALLAVVGAGLLPLGYLVGGLIWAFHVAVDRSLGYGLRDRAGFQRPQ